VRVEAEALIAAPPEVVYGVVADYRNGHQRIVPKQYFPELIVERGGVGAGTVIRFKMRLLGATREMRAEVTEPDPGRVLVETDLDGGTRSTFTVSPRDDGRASHVTIVTELPGRGLKGWMEAMVARSLLRKIYAEELDNLARVATEARKET